MKHSLEHPRTVTRFLLSGSAALLSVLAVSCASNDQNPYGNPCRAMELEADEMRAVETEIDGIRDQETRQGR